MLFALAVHLPAQMGDLYGEPDVARLVNSALLWTRAGVRTTALSQYLYYTSPAYIGLITILLPGTPGAWAPAASALNAINLIAAVVITVPLFLLFRRIASARAALIGTLFLTIVPAFWQGGLYGFPTLPAALFMSPEQATAEKEITARSDVYSLAAVLYEMLAGHPPHTGASAQQIIVKIVAEDAAPVTRERKSVPAHIAAALGKALEKLPADRFASAADFARALAGEARPGELTRVTRAPTLRRSHRPRHPMLGWICAALLAAVVGAQAWGRPPTVTSSSQVFRFGIDLPSTARLGGTAPAPRLSPDGRRLVIPAVMCRDLEGRGPSIPRGAYASPTRG